VTFNGIAADVVKGIFSQNQSHTTYKARHTGQHVSADYTMIRPFSRKLNRREISTFAI
jgi:hypothetical protein